MEFTLTKDSATSTMFTPVNDEDAPVYRVITGSKLFSTERTVITKIQRGQWKEMGLIELHTFHKDVLRLWGQDVDVFRENMWR
jgi:hypothetical protein